MRKILFVLSALSSVIFLFAPTTQAAFSFAVYGDSRSGHEAHQAVVNQIVAKNPGFVLHTGDFVSTGGSVADWTQFQTIAAPLLSKTPLTGLSRGFFPSIGNHDLPIDNYFSTFGMNDYYYSFNYQNFHFISLNSEQDYSIGSAQYNWLATDLDNALNKNIVVFLHRPAYSSGPHGSETEIIENLVPQFEERGVKFVFSGHDHIYERTYPIYQGAVNNERGIIYTVTGAGGAPLYGVTPGNWWTAKAQSIYHFIYFQFTGDKFLSTAIDKDGNIIDSFEMASSNIASPSISINSGKGITNSRQVTLAISATNNPYQMIISENSDFSGADWEAYVTTKSYTLSDGNSTKTVYVKFRDAIENESASASDTIRYIKNPKFVTKNAVKNNEVLIAEKNIKYSARNFSLIFKLFPKKLKNGRYYLQSTLFTSKYPKTFTSPKKVILKKYWKISTNLNKYVAKTKSQKYKLKLGFSYTEAELKALKKKNKSVSEKGLVLKHYDTATKTWKKAKAYHNLKNNSFKIAYNKLVDSVLYFAIGK